MTGNGFTDVLVYTIGLGLILRAIAAGLKQIGFTPSYVWIVETVLGAVVVDVGLITKALVITGFAGALPAQLFFGSTYGVICGLTAAGLYNNVKAITGGNDGG